MVLEPEEYLVITDNHLTTTSSVISGRGERFSDRLEGQITDIKWVNSFNLPIIHLGDFIDKANITAEEQMAIDEIKPYTKDWVFLRGNHEYSGNYDVLGALGGRYIRKPTEAKIGGLSALFLPFNSIPNDITKHYDIIFGHLGIENIPFGAKGFDFSIIDKNCDIFLNGHLHNRYEFSNLKWNIGSLTSQNFSDNCINYRKGAVILNTRKKTLTFVENPNAFNFYKFSWADYQKSWADPQNPVGKAIRGNRSCLSISCKEGEKQKILDSNEFESVYYLRISEEVSQKVKKSSVVVGPGLDHISRFRESFIGRAGDSKLVAEELAEVLR